MPLHINHLSNRYISFNQTNQCPVYHRKMKFLHPKGTREQIWLCLRISRWAGCEPGLLSGYVTCIVLMGLPIGYLFMLAGDYDYLFNEKTKIIPKIAGLM